MYIFIFSIVYICMWLYLMKEFSLSFLFNDHVLFNDVIRKFVGKKIINNLFCIVFF